MYLGRDGKCRRGGVIHKVWSLTLTGYVNENCPVIIQAVDYQIISYICDHMCIHNSGSDVIVIDQICFGLGANHIS